MPYTLKLRSGVGPYLSNHPEDLASATTGLAALGRYSPDNDPLFGSLSPMLQSAINRFQRGKGLREDGQIHPGGATEAAMNSELAAKARTGQARDFHLNGEVGEAPDPSVQKDCQREQIMYKWVVSGVRGAFPWVESVVPAASAS